jgi:hypothetical protein
MTGEERRRGWPDRWGRRHTRAAIVVRSLLAPWILFVIVALCLDGRWWGLAFVPFLALDVWLLRDLVRYARAQRP